MNPIETKNKTLMLYFHAKTVASEAEKEAGIAAAKSVNASLRFRNGGIPVDGSIEPCDFVAGVAPREYRDRITYVGDTGAITEAPKKGDDKAAADSLTARNAAPAPTTASVSALEEEIGEAPKPANPWK